MWKNRSAAYFRSISPSIIAQTAHWVNFWAGIQRQGQGEQQQRGAKIATATIGRAEIFGRK
jgi:hypothetical protein